MIDLVGQKGHGESPSTMSMVSTVNDCDLEPSPKPGAFPSFACLSSQPKAIQIIERWEFIRGCLAFWLRQACPDCEIMAAPDFEHPIDDGFEGHIAAIVVGRDTLRSADDWLEHQLSLVRQRRPDVPVVAIISTDLMDMTEAWIKRFSLSGYILTSESTEVASAALRLVMAGGTHFPRLPAQAGIEAKAKSDRPIVITRGLLLETLTQREMDVVNCLGRGTPNKIIAHELSMSLSTVKAHVHSILRKLKLNNRTEAAVIAQSIQDVMGPPARG